MAGVSNPGHYFCPRCKGVEVYESKETVGAFAVSFDSPGPVDPTLVNRIQGTVVRCVNCAEKAVWIDSPEAIAANKRQKSVEYAWVGGIFGVVFLCLGIFILSSDVPGTSGLMFGSFFGSAVFFLIGYTGYSSAKRNQTN